MFLLLALFLIGAGALFLWLHLRTLSAATREGVSLSRTRPVLLVGLAYAAWTGATASLAYDVLMRHFPTPPEGALLYVLLLASAKYAADFDSVVAAWMRPPGAERRIADEMAIWSAAVAVQMAVGVSLLPLLATCPFPAVLTAAFVVHAAAVAGMTAIACNVRSSRGDRGDVKLPPSALWMGTLRYMAGLGTLFTLFHLILWFAQSPWMPPTNTTVTAFLFGVGFMGYILFQTTTEQWAKAAVPEMSRDAAPAAAEAVS